MTISTTDNRISYAGNGVTLEFSFPYLFFSANDLVVSLITNSTGEAVVQVLNTDYTLTGEGTPTSGSISMIEAPTSLQTILIVRALPYTQTADYLEGDAFPAEAHERALDKATILIQQLLEQVDRSFRLPSNYAGSASTDLPTPSALSYLRWNATALALENASATVSVIATDVPFTPTGSIASTNVQAAIAELGTEKQDFDADIPTVSASQAEMEAGTSSSLRSMTPQRVKQAIDYLSVPRLPTRYNNSTETLTVAEMNTLTVSALSSSITKTLPASTGLNNGVTVAFKIESTSGNFLTVTAGGSDNIDWGFGGLSNTFRMANSCDLVVLSLNKTNALWEVIVDRVAGPYFKATRVNSSQSIGNNTFTKCQFNTEVEDTHSNYDNSTNYRFTPEIEGNYRIECAAFTSASGRHAVVLYKNGAFFKYGSRTYTTTDCVNFGNWEVYLNGSTDYVEIYAISLDASGTFASAVSIESHFEARRKR